MYYRVLMCFVYLHSSPAVRILLAVPHTPTDSHAVAWAEHKKECIGKSYKLIKC